MASQASNDDIDLSMHSMQSSKVSEALGWNDIKIGRILGKGSFSKVKEVTFRNRRLGNGNKKYAIKYLRRSAMTTKQQAVSSNAAIQGLAMEGQLLSFLKHENIIKLYAQGYKNDCEQQQFLIMDRLRDTLERSLKDWIYTMPFFESNISWQVPSRVERIQSIALPVANALEYLHSNDIVFRDVKPSNIGFTCNGTVKLFDFGLARVVKEDNGRKLTGRVGSPLYMAPEVTFSQDYGLPVDVYSFAIILWELLTLDVPFEGMTQNELERAVVRENARPIVDKSIGSPALQELISNAWDPLPESRPTFNTIRKVLEDEDEVASLGMEITIEIQSSSSSAEGELVSRQESGARAA